MSFLTDKYFYIIKIITHKKNKRRKESELEKVFIASPAY